MAENKAIKLEQLEYVKQYSEDNFIAKSSVGDGLNIDEAGKLNVTVEGLTVDDALSDTSEHPVQNKVIKAALDEKADLSDIPTTLPANGGNADTLGGKHDYDFLQSIATNTLTHSIDESFAGTYSVEQSYTPNFPTGFGTFGILDARIYGSIQYQTIQFENGVIIHRSKIINQTDWTDWQKINDEGNANSLRGITVSNNGYDLIGNATTSGGKFVTGVFDEQGGTTAFFDVRLANGNLARLQINPNYQDTSCMIFTYDAETDTWKESTVNKSSWSSATAHQIAHDLDPKGELNINVLEYAAGDTCPSGVNTIVRIMNSPACPTNYGYDGTNNDFWYDIYKLDSKYITIKAYDVRTNFEYTRSCYDGKWSDWVRCGDGGNAYSLANKPEHYFMQWFGFQTDNTILGNANFKCNYHCNIDDGTRIGLPVAGWYHIVYYMHMNDNGFGMQIAYPLNFDGATMIRRASGTTWDNSEWKNVADGGRAATVATLNQDGTSFGAAWQMKAQYNKTGDGTFRVYCGDGSVWTSVNRADEATYANSSGLTHTASNFCLRNLASGTVEATWDSSTSTGNCPNGAWYGKHS